MGKTYRFWDERRGIIRTHKGGWLVGKGAISHGYSLMDDILGKMSYFQLHILNITGQVPDRAVSSWAEALYQCLSFPDSRIWCNQVGALAGTSRASAVSGVTAGILASDSRMYGPGTIHLIYAVFQDNINAWQEGGTLESILAAYQRRKGGRAKVPGFGHPLATADGRIIAMEQLSKGLGLEAGPHLKFAYAIEDYLQATQGESMNLAAYGTATMMDFGWTLPQIQQVCAIIVISGVAACYGEAYENPPESFLPLRCEDIEYRGHAPRPVPEAGEEGGD